jgi:hypothetical protein
LGAAAAVVTAHRPGSLKGGTLFFDVANLAGRLGGRPPFRAAFEFAMQQVG